MFVLDDLYVSREVLDYLEESQEPVFLTPAAQKAAQHRNLNICQSEEELTAAIAVSPRTCALSEMHLDEVKGFCSASTARAIELCKDKAAFRRALKPLYPNYVFEEYDLEGILALDPEDVTYPVVVKPATGFFSLGIYPVFNSDDLALAKKDIEASSHSWSNSYNASVVNDTNFLVESYIEGDEYAVDVYFDEKGEAVILDILKHDFSGSDDVSDRLYYTSKEVIESQLERMSRFFAETNAIFEMKDFPLHAEVRIGSDGQIIPVEFNPLRFAGLCTTDVGYFAYGLKTYEYFLRNKRPDWDTLLAGKDDVVYAMILLTKAGFEADKPHSFDYDALKARFNKVLELRESDISELGTFGFLFTETKNDDWGKELDSILVSDLEEFISYE